MRGFFQRFIKTADEILATLHRQRSHETVH
jgi:hypothetical protein